MVTTPPLAHSYVYINDFMANISKFKLTAQRF